MSLLNLQYNYYLFASSYKWWWPFGGTDVEEDILNDNLLGGQVFKQRIDEMWTTYIGPNADGAAHPVWTISVRLAGYIAIPMLAWMLMLMFKKFSQDEDFFGELDKIVFLIVILALLTNNGYLAGNLARSMRGLVVGIDRQIAQDITAYNTEYNDIKDVVGGAQARKFILEADRQCQEKILGDNEEYKTCLETEVNAKIESIEAVGTTNQGLLGGLKKFIGGGANLASYLGQTYVLADDRLKLFLTGLAFSIAADIAMFATALFTPIALAASLMPTGQKAVFAWLAAFYGIGATKVSYTLLVSLMASVLADQDGIGDFVMALAIGRIVPITAIALGTGGGMAFFSSLSSIGVDMASKAGVSRTVSALFRK